MTLTGSFVNGALALVSGAQTGTTFVNATTIKVASWVPATATSVAIQIENPGTLWGPVFNAPVVPSGPPPATTISPASANVNLSATQQFTSNNATGWSASAGTITAAGLFTAPATMPASSQVKITATGPGGSASATVTLINPNPQVIAPSAVTLSLGATQQFTSTGATAWTAQYGTIDATGFYTAPSVWPASGADTVGVTGPNGNASAAVTLTPPTPVISGVGATNSLPLGIYSTTIAGTGFTAQSIAQLNGTTVTVAYAAGSLTISGFANQSGTATLVVSNGSVSSAPFTVQVGVAAPQVSSIAARRFLQQAAFGPTPRMPIMCSRSDSRPG